MSRKQPPEWREVSRELDRRTLYVSERGHGGMTFGYVAAVYRVRRALYDGDTMIASVEEHETGNPLYEHENGYAATMIAALRPLADHLRHMCAERDAPPPGRGTGSR